MIETFVITTDQSDECEALLDTFGIIYNVEYVPSQFKKTDHFGEVYSDDILLQTTFTFSDPTMFDEVCELLHQHQVEFQAHKEQHEVIDYQKVFEDTYPLIEIGRYVIVPTWKQNTPTTREKIIINPSTGFGTGHSMTTQLCLEWTSIQDFSGNEVLDFGSGSGILAIAAMKQKAKHVVALEIDVEACKSARENIRENHFEDTITVQQTETGTYDVLVMNVTQPIFMTFFSDVWKRIKSRGYISGIKEGEQQSVCDFFEKNMISYHMIEKDGWYGFEVRKECNNIL